MKNKENMKEYQKKSIGELAHVMLELLWFAIAAGSIAFVVRVEMWCARLCIQNDANFYVSAFLFVFVAALVVYFLIKVNKKWTRKHLY